jgi:hypothetical protein
MLRKDKKMAERFQIFVKLNHKVSIRKNNDSKRQVKSDLVGFHHQWMYGEVAPQRLGQLASYFEKQSDDKYSVFKSEHYTEEIIPALRSLLIMNMDHGDYNGRLTTLPSDQLDPVYQDINNGQLFIDLTGVKTKYVFLCYRTYKFMDVKAYLAEYSSDVDQEYMDLILSRTNDLEVMTDTDVYKLFPELNKELTKLRLSNMFKSN